MKFCVFRVLEAQLGYICSKYQQVRE